MKTKQHSLWFRALSACMAAILLTVSTPLPALAVDVQSLPLESQAAHGFTHAARVTWDDLNASDNALTTLQLFLIPTNTYVDRVAYYIEEPFTNSTISATNLLMSIGIPGTTNRFIAGQEIDQSTTMDLSGLTIQTLSTNLLIPYKSTTSTNYLIGTFSSGASTVDTYTRGKVRIYWRLINPAKLRF